MGVGIGHARRVFINEASLLVRPVERSPGHAGKGERGLGEAAARRAPRTTLERGGNAGGRLLPGRRHLRLALALGSEFVEDPLKDDIDEPPPLPAWQVEGGQRLAQHALIDAEGAQERSGRHADQRMHPPHRPPPRGMGFGIEQGIEQGIEMLALSEAEPVALTLGEPGEDHRTFPLPGELGVEGIDETSAQAAEEGASVGEQSGGLRPIGEGRGRE